MSSVTVDPIDALYDAIQRRPRPEDVAELIVSLFPRAASKPVIVSASRGSFRQNLYGWSSMASDFARPIGAEKQVKKACELFKIPDVPDVAACLDPVRVQAFLDRVSPMIQFVPGQTNFRTNRLDRSQRKTAGLDMRKRQYNKRWRLLKRLDDKIRRMIRNSAKYEFTRVGKSALATKLTREDIAKDLPTACFVAYLSARMSMRSVFTNTSQERAFDTVAKALLDLAMESPTINWWAIAHVHPEWEVLAKLSEGEKGRLLGMSFGLLKGVGDFLAGEWAKLDVNRSTLIVQRGNDSSTWNNTAGAWNKTRDLWFSVVHALDMGDILDSMCPGKVLRLMAADVAYWHRSSGGDVHPDTKVWAEIPLPWEVLKGEDRCTRDDVEMACAKYKVKVEGWTGPRPSKKAVDFKPTPELVNGVVVSSPALALALRKAGWFSSKGVKDPMITAKVIRDVHGAATLVTGDEKVLDFRHT